LSFLLTHPAPPLTYTLSLHDALPILTRVRHELRDNPNLSNPRNINQVFEALKLQTSVKRTNLVVRVPTTEAGVALNGESLPSLRSEEHTSELQSLAYLVCRLLLEKKK